ncbi:MAG: methyltransferase domain-containing protein [Eggerthellaceae bacterium]|jgi:16S rRNA (cytosine967-C5)-methyltransferase|nr:methyltransferase domain-containing protein [Eggerthellaceae bacterium]MDR2721702.1 methyltransferase domain-containing protein [Coriobacteriaceae bacterium]
MPGKNYRVKASPARRAALEVGTQVRQRSAFTSELAAKHIDQADMSPSDKAFARRLALGVTSAQGTLDEMLNNALHDPRELDPLIRDALRISCYEIIFLEKSGYAAVDQGVELVKSVNPKAGGLANAVLRKILAAKDTFPWGDVKSDTAAFARLYAFPLWLTELLITEFGREGAQAFMEASNDPSPLFIAVNALKASDTEVEAVFSALDVRLFAISLADTPIPGCFLLKDSKALLAPEIKALIDEGKILVSDAASQFIAAHILPDVLPERFLEIGAGRATKTILLQSGAYRRFNSQMSFTALDNHGFKMKLLKQRAKTYGVALVEARVVDARKLSATFPEKSFDFVFLDAPCSGLGTLRRHPEIRWRIQPRDITVLAEQGFSLLEEAAKQVKVGGHLAYSTCTITREENNAVIERFLKSDAGKDFELEPIAGKAAFASVVYRGSSDAHFAVRMARIQ